MLYTAFAFVLYKISNLSPSARVCIRSYTTRPLMLYIYRLHEIELLKSRKNIILTKSVYMASITSGEMADCDWLRSTFSGHYSKTK
jgi:hypothetical protein